MESTRLRCRFSGILSLIFPLLLLFCAPVIVTAQTECEGEYRPYRFVTPEGEEMYFGHAVLIEPYADRYLIVQNGPRYIRYTLPGLEYVDQRTMAVFVWSIHPLWEEDGTFWTNDVPMSHFGEGLFAHFNARGEVLGIFGEFDPMERYGRPRMLQITMNGGGLYRRPDGNFAFIYGYQPRMLVFSPSGEQIRDLELDMPWFGRGRINPFRSEQFGWAARSVIESVTIQDDGFLISSSGLDRRRSRFVPVLAWYTWQGELRETIYLPEPEPREDRLNAATVLNGRYFVLLHGDPAVMEVIVTP